MFKTSFSKKDLSLNVTRKDEKIPKIWIMDEFEIIADDMIAQNKRKRTVDDYRYHLNNMLERSKISTFDKLNRQVLMKYIGDASVSDATRLVRFKSIRAVLNRFYRKGLLKEDFWSEVSIKVDQKSKVGATQREVEMLLYLLDFSKFTEFRDACAILLIWETGARMGTIAKTTENMIDHENLLIRWSGSAMKNHIALTLPISKNLSDMLKELSRVNVEVRHKNNVTNDLMFITSNALSIEKSNYTNILVKRLSNYKKKYKLNNINGHALRRGFAKELLNQGLSVPIISKALNHSDLAVTTKYLNISDEEVIDSIRLTRGDDKND